MPDATFLKISGVKLELNLNENYGSCILIFKIKMYDPK